MSSSIESDRLPRGSRGWRAFAESLRLVSDTAETHWLEMKSELDLSRTGAAKLAKFILGAANRQPEVAARFLEGYALMVLGVAPGLLPGVEPVEDLDLEKRLLPFLGADGPRWEAVRVPVAEERDVLVILVEPPKPGDPIYVCRKDGDGVADGDVYIRARGETRRAKSGEMDLLRARERGRIPNIELDVSVLGPVRAYTCEAGILDDYAERRRRRLLEGLPRPRPPAHFVPGETDAGESPLAIPFSSLLTTALAESSMSSITRALTLPEDRTEKAFREEVEAWATVCRRSHGWLIDGLIARKAPTTTFVVRNLTDRYLADVQVRLHLAGAVEQVATDFGESFVARAWLPREPRPWGPRQRDLGLAGYGTQHVYTPDPSSIRPTTGPQASFRNGGSVEAELELPELRPQGREDFGDEIVLVVRDPSVTSIDGQWSATARDVHAVFQGTCVVPVDEPVDLTDRLRAALARD